MPITIREVAQRLGISISTVSRALDGYPDIALETRQRVQQAAREMGYVPNQAARQLRRKKADAIGYILPANAPRFADPFHAEFLAGLGDETSLHPFDLLISIAPPGDEAEQHIYTNWVLSRKVDGFVLNRVRRDDWRGQFLSEHGVFFAALENGHAELDYPYVEVDHFLGMTTLVQHLAQAGFRRLAFIGGPPDLVIHIRRLAGFRQALEQANLPFDLNLILTGDLTSDGGYQAVKQMRWIPGPPDAMICINDETAFGVLHALHEMGLQIGTDIAVTGFDGVRASQHTDPPLTTLDVPVYEIARQLVRMLAAEMNALPLASRQVIVQPRLLVRRSTIGERPV